MCLRIVTNTHLKKSENSGYAYKVFKIKDKTLTGLFIGEVIPRNKWIHKNDFTPTKNELNRVEKIEGYTPGFHMYKDLLGAQSFINTVSRYGICRNSIILKIKYRGATVMGETIVKTNLPNLFSSSYSSSIVAKEILVLPKNRQDVNRK